MERIYYPDHDKRYAHIDPEERWEYPDEVRIAGHGRFIRELTYDEVDKGVDIETALRLVGWEGRRESLEKRIGKPLPKTWWFGPHTIFLAKDKSIKKCYMD